jgi:arginine deiminase
MAIRQCLASYEQAAPYYSATYDYLGSLTIPELADALIAGLTFDEVPGMASWCKALVEPTGFLLPPLPNLVFMRDSSAMLYGSVHLPRMQKIARRRESLVASLIHRAIGPQLTASSFTASVEGGDILVLGHERLLIGVGERTGGHAAVTLATEFLTRHPGGAAILVPLPRARWAMHLDTVLTMVDHARFLAYGSLIAELQGFEFRSKNGVAECVRSGSIIDIISAGQGGAEVEFIEIYGSADHLEVEQWNDAYNVLAVAPNVVMGYARNHACNEQLVSYGIKVLPIVGSELGKGRGGPRCMSCPLLRQA